MEIIHRRIITINTRTMQQPQGRVPAAMGPNPGAIRQTQAVRIALLTRSLSHLSPILPNNMASRGLEGRLNFVDPSLRKSVRMLQLMVIQVTGSGCKGMVSKDILRSKMVVWAGTVDKATICLHPHRHTSKALPHKVRIDCRALGSRLSAQHPHQSRDLIRERSGKVG